jgi:hypothetical protein
LKKWLGITVKPVLESWDGRSFNDLKYPYDSEEEITLQGRLWSLLNYHSKDKSIELSQDVADSRILKVVFMTEILLI